MAQITLKGNTINTNGNLPVAGDVAPDFSLVKADLSELTLSSLEGKKVILNIFPSLDTGTCAASVRAFNKSASSLEDTMVLCISADLPFAHGRFCETEGIDNVVTLSSFRSNDFADNYGVMIIDGPLKGLCARSVVVIDEDRKVKYTELVSETVDEPDYKAALSIL